MKLREGFREIISGWTLINDWDALEDRIERALEWVKGNEPPWPDEEATIEAMIQTKIALDEDREEEE